MMMIENYRAEVRRFYEMQRDMGNLSMNLTYPTVSRLRNECLRLFNEGCNEADVRILTSFLQRPANVELQEAAIRRCDPDKFKALCNFMKRDIKTSEKNFELLAWLIDFKPRQFSKYVFEEKRKREIACKHLANMENPSLSQMVIGAAKVQNDAVLHDTAVSIPYNSASAKEFSFHRSSVLGDRQRCKLISNQNADSIDLSIGGDESITATHQPAGGKIGQQEVAHKPESDNDVSQNQITLEYPSGVKLTLSTSDLGLLSKLIRL